MLFFIPSSNLLQVLCALSPSLTGTLGTPAAASLGTPKVEDLDSPTGATLGTTPAAEAEYPARGATAPGTVATGTPGATAPGTVARGTLGGSSLSTVTSRAAVLTLATGTATSTLDSRE